MRHNRNPVWNCLVKLNDKITVLVNTCDAYSDVWPLFFASLDEFWSNRVIDVVLNTDHGAVACPDYPNVFMHQSNARSWGERLISVLDDIQSDYVFMLFDDFILEDVFDEKILTETIMELENDEAISVFYLDLMGLETAENHSRLPGFALISPKADFRLNSGPAVWRKADLKKFTGGQDNPWAWEAFGTYRTQKTSKKFYQPTRVQYFPFNAMQGGAIYRGKWVADVVVDKARKYNLSIDFSIRGFASTENLEKRSVVWKMKFLWIGFQMIGFDIVKFIFSAIKKKMMS